MELIKGLINYISGPTVLFTLTAVVFALSLIYTEVWSKRAGMIVLVVSVSFFFLSLFDPNFWLIVAKPDNVPISAMLFLVGFFTWFAMHQGVENDKRIARGEQPLEKGEEEKVWVWPDLVYVELICLVIVTIVLVVWSIFLLAPIEQPANPADSPNPSKAPWYFSGASGDARLFRSLAGGGGVPHPDRHRVDGHSVYRHESQGERLLHVEGATRRDRAFPLRLSRSLDSHGRLGHVFSGGRTGTSSAPMSTGTFIASSRFSM